jgi:hypothetical protein
MPRAAARLPTPTLSWSSAAMRARGAFGVIRAHALVRWVSFLSFEPCYLCDAPVYQPQCPGVIGVAPRPPFLGVSSLDLGRSAFARAASFFSAPQKAQLLSLARRRHAPHLPFIACGGVGRRVIGRIMGGRRQRADRGLSVQLNPCKRQRWARRYCEWEGALWGITRLGVSWWPWPKNWPWPENKQGPHRASRGGREAGSEPL